jgi:glycerophosphoryl diester phosphodiesterase
MTASCAKRMHMQDSKSTNIEVQGHRGCRGLMPENTIPAFLYAMDLGTRILELDVVISSDNQVIVSHEAHFNHELTQSIKGVAVTEENQKSYNIYKMTAAEIQSIDVGSKINPKYPNQRKLKAFKPLLSDVLSQCDAYAKSKGLPLPFYNIEIKRDKSQDGIFNPPADEFVRLVHGAIKKQNIKDRFNIQSFDHETANLYHALDPLAKVAILVGDQDGMESHLMRLNFVPYAYSPYYLLVNDDLVKACHKKNIKVIPWTVNDKEAVQKLIALQVDGIISDYPDMVIEQLKNKK